MSTQTFHLPDVGEGLTEAEIVQWRVAPGDTIAVNDVIVEIETAKSLVELPSPFAGTIGELLAAEGDTVTVGAPIITIVGAAGTPDASATARAAPSSRVAAGQRLVPRPCASQPASSRSRPCASSPAISTSTSHRSHPPALRAR